MTIVDLISLDEKDVCFQTVLSYHAEGKEQKEVIRKVAPHLWISLDTVSNNWESSDLEGICFGISCQMAGKFLSKIASSKYLSKIEVGELTPLPQM